PPSCTFKLNTDGSALNNPSKIGGGGILRDDKGEMIYAFTISLGIDTNNQAEAQAASHGIQWCIQHDFRNVVLEVHSELLIKWITSNVNYYIKELQTLISQLDYFQCQHTFREANCTANYLSKWSHNFDITQHYYTFIQLPVAAKGSFLLEKMGVVNFIRKRLKRIKHPP
ncbi:hypothetical protein MTR67_048594, partial [Solanum verrucosum]